MRDNVVPIGESVTSIQDQGHSVIHLNQIMNIYSSIKMLTIDDANLNLNGSYKLAENGTPLERNYRDLDKIESLRCQLIFE